MTQITVTYKDHMGTDLSVVNAARVSYLKRSNGVVIEHDLLHDDPNMIKASVDKCKKEGWVISQDLDNWKIIIQKPTVGDNRLIKYLAKHNHKSPFNHTFATFHVKAPIYVARQLVKHKFMPWNEVSGRYVVFRGEFYTPDRFRMSSADKKQGSGDNASDELNAVFTTIFTDGQLRALAEYEKCIEMGMAEELARSRLPFDLMTEWYWSGTVGAFSDMCKLRCQPDAQHESQLVANPISAKMGELYPVSWAALMGCNDG